MLKNYLLLIFIICFAHSFSKADDADAEVPSSHARRPTSDSTSHGDIEMGGATHASPAASHSTHDALPEEDGYLSNRASRISERQPVAELVLFPATPCERVIHHFSTEEEVAIYLAISRWCFRTGFSFAPFVGVGAGIAAHYCGYSALCSIAIGLGGWTTAHNLFVLCQNRFYVRDLG